MLAATVGVRRAAKSGQCGCLEPSLESRRRLSGGTEPFTERDEDDVRSVLSALGYSKLRQFEQSFCIGVRLFNC